MYVSHCIPTFQNIVFQNWVILKFLDSEKLFFIEKPLFIYVYVSLVRILFLITLLFNL